MPAENFDPDGLDPNIFEDDLKPVAEEASAPEETKVAEAAPETVEEPKPEGVEPPKKDPEAKPEEDDDEEEESPSVTAAKGKRVRVSDPSDLKFHNLRRAGLSPQEAAKIAYGAPQQEQSAEQDDPLTKAEAELKDVETQLEALAQKEDFYGPEHRALQKKEAALNTKISELKTDQRIEATTYQTRFQDAWDNERSVALQEFPDAGKPGTPLHRYLSAVADQYSQSTECPEPALAAHWGQPTLGAALIRHAAEMLSVKSAKAQPVATVTTQAGAKSSSSGIAPLVGRTTPAAPTGAAPSLKEKLSALDPNDYEAGARVLSQDIWGKDEEPSPFGDVFA